MSKHGTADWQDRALRSVLDQRHSAAGWAYRQAASPCVEPTTLAALALQAGPERDSYRPTVRQAADWLVSLQQADGSVGVSAHLTSPGWGTPYAILLWNALGVHSSARSHAVKWLLAQKGTTEPVDPKRVVGHDTSLAGWPWVDHTHSWIEPTALAVMALRREGMGDHPRVREGIRVICDRAIVTGGWNCGNKEVYGRPLRPQPGPTGLALLALAPLGGRPALVVGAIDYLRTTLPEVCASESLGWGLLGLRAWGERPEAADRWLSESFDAVAARNDAVPRLALLLLAAGEYALELFNG